MWPCYFFLCCRSKRDPPVEVAKRAIRAAQDPNGFKATKINKIKGMILTKKNGGWDGVSGWGRDGWVLKGNLLVIGCIRPGLSGVTPNVDRSLTLPISLQWVSFVNKQSYNIKRSSIYLICLVRLVNAYRKIYLDHSRNKN